jgi:hypothetical protein
MKYTGTIVEESLRDNRILNDVEVLKVHITNAANPLDRWHLYTVRLEGEKLSTLAAALKTRKVVRSLLAWR